MITYPPGKIYRRTLWDQATARQGPLFGGSSRCSTHSAYPFACPYTHSRCYFVGGHPERRGNGVYALYDRYWRRTFTAAYTRIGDQAVCEEIVQAIFLTDVTQSLA